MRYESKPNWIAREEEARMEEQSRRIERYIREHHQGTLCPDREHIVEALRKKIHEKK